MGNFLVCCESIYIGINPDLAALDASPFTRRSIGICFMESIDAVAVRVSSRGRVDTGFIN